MDISITFLGTGSSMPTEKRNHTGILVSYGSHNFLVDCGEGIQRQFKIAKLNPCKLTHIFITHWHGDHTFGIPGLLETLAMSGYKKKLLLYGPRGTKEKLSLIQKTYGSFKIQLEVKEVSSGKILESEDLEIHSAPASHGSPTNSYAFILKDKLRIDKSKLKKLKLPNSPLIAKLQQGKDIVHPLTKKKIKASQLTYLQKGKKLSIILDSTTSESLVKLSKNSDLLICEASFLSSEDNGESLAKEYKHMTAKQAATIAKKAKVSALILTHISQRYEHVQQKILDEAKKIFRNVSIAKDFSTIKI